MSRGPDANVNLVVLTPLKAHCTATDRWLEVVESFRSGLCGVGDIAKHVSKYGTVEREQCVPVQATDEPPRLEEHVLGDDCRTGLLFC